MHKSIKMMMLFLSAFSLTGNMLSGADLMKNGKSLASIVVAPASDRVVKHAAKELSLYLGKISDGKKPQISGKEIKNLHNIILTQDIKTLSEAEKKEAEKIRDDGFLISTTPARTVIYAKMARGVLYGAYEILKTHGGIRWVTPGPDGEYYKVKKVISIPEGMKVHNPSFSIRSQIFGSANVNSFLKYTWDWMVRNNMWIASGADVIANNGTDYLLDRAGGTYKGGHAVASLMTGSWISCTGIRGRKNFELLQKKHPEYFPIINGKREFGRFGQNNPCLAHKGLYDLMRGNLFLAAEKMRKNPASFFVIGNNDNTIWCQCEVCSKIDPPAEKEKQMISTRYWTLLNTLAAPVFEKYPDAKLWGWAYQNFQDTPKGNVKPDPRFTIMLTYNARCYRHLLTDPKCIRNKVYLQYFRNWQAYPNKKCTWEQVEDGMAVKYQPFENIMAGNIIDMKKMNMDGMMICNYPPDGTYGKRHDSYRMHPRHTWYQMWRSVYIASRLLWDVNRPWEKELDEAGSLYYGAAWKKGMKAYCALLLKTEQEAEGCMGWGNSGSDPGILLKDPKVHNKLRSLLASAESAVIFDPRAAAHVARERFYFEKQWEYFLEEYKKRRPAITALPRTEKIVLDGVLDEADWKKAEKVTSFTAMASGQGRSKLAKPQTYFKVIHEPDYLYIGAVAQEPQMDKIIHNSTKHDGDVWVDNEMEFFIHHPYLNQDYYHICITSGGNYYDGYKIWGVSNEDDKWSSNAEFKVRRNKDSWVIEMRIPTSTMRMKCRPGDIWKINVARSRRIEGGRYGIENELSSSSGGRFHNAAFFTELILKGK